MKNIAEKIVTLRTAQGLTPEELCKALEDISWAEYTLTPTVLAAYEEGSLTPTLDFVYYFARCCGVSSDTILGIVEESIPIQKAVKSPKPMCYGKLIPKEDYPLYDNQPVYATNLGDEQPDGWCVLNHTKKYLVFANVLRPLNNDVRLYSLATEGDA